MSKASKQEWKLKAQPHLEVLLSRLETEVQCSISTGAPESDLGRIPKQSSKSNLGGCLLCLKKAWKDRWAAVVGAARAAIRTQGCVPKTPLWRLALVRGPVAEGKLALLALRAQELHAPSSCQRCAQTSALRQRKRSGRGSTRRHKGEQVRAPGFRLSQTERSRGALHATVLGIFVQPLH